MPIIIGLSVESATAVQIVLLSPLRAAISTACPISVSVSLVAIVLVLGLVLLVAKVVVVSAILVIKLLLLHEHAVQLDVAVVHH